MLKLGLIGKDISHSRSKEMYEKLLGTEVDYHLLDYANEADIPPLDDLFNEGFKGLSVTYPYKLSFGNQVTYDNEIVKDLGAINCIQRVNDSITATNTDYLAALDLTNEYQKQYPHHEFVILGSGNMANVFKAVFHKLGLNYLELNRKKDGDLNKVNYHELTSSSLFVINCCSRAFAFKSELPDKSIFWDMNYSFQAHSHLKNSDISYIEGDGLLMFQAKFALNFWNIQHL